MNRGKREKYVPPAEQAAREQAQADRIIRTVEAVEHYLHLKRKFGPRC